MPAGTWRRAATAACAVTAVALAACGSSGSSGSSEPSSSAASAKVSPEASKAIDAFIGKPGAFPITEPLKRVPKGANMVFMDCGTPTCALFWSLLQPAAKTMGVNLSRVKAGSQANTVSAAFDTVVSQKPDAVLVSAIDPELWKNQLKQLQEEKVTVVTNGIVQAADYGIEAPGYARNETERDGALLADYVAAKMGASSKVAMYDVPELPVATGISKSFTAELAKVCPGCSTRTVHVPVATLGNTAPSRIVSDLQANPDTTVAVFAVDEMSSGLPSALKAASIDVKTLGNVPTPTNLQYLKQGQETASLATDLPVMMWGMIDKAARGIVGQKPVGDQAKGLVDVQFLTQSDIKFDPAKGWTGYPDFPQRFAKLWGLGQ